MGTRFAELPTPDATHPLPFPSPDARVEGFASLQMVKIAIDGLKEYDRKGVATPYDVEVDYVPTPGRKLVSAPALRAWLGTDDLWTPALAEGAASAVLEYLRENYTFQSMMVTVGMKLAAEVTVTAVCSWAAALEKEVE